MEDSLRQREKSRLLRVTMPDGTVICYNRSSETFIEALRKLGSEHYSKINLMVAGVPFFSKEIYPNFKDSMKELCDGWFVVMTGGTSGRYIQLRSIAQQLGINMEVELGDNFVTTKAKTEYIRVKRDDKLLVKFPNGEYAAGENPIDTLIDAIWQVDPEKILRKELEYKGKPIITLSKKFNGQVQVGKNFWLTVPGTTKEKFKMLSIINLMMKLGLEITIL